MADPRQAWWRSFRARMLLIVLALGVIPLGVVGLWLTGSAARGGEALLRSRMSEALEASVAELGTRWVRARSWMLDLAALPATRALLAPGVPASAWPEFALPAGVVRAALRLPDGTVRAERLGIDPSGGASIRATIGIQAADTGGVIGALVVDFSADSLIVPAMRGAGVTGVPVAALDTLGVSLLGSLPFEESLLAQLEFVWGGERWITERILLQEPRVTLVAASPVAVFDGPFRSAARRGAVLILLVAAAGTLLLLASTQRLARGLDTLASAADAVAAGDLGRTVEVRSSDEVGRVARAFNTMTETLRRTLQELSLREARAAAGEFAASLAHEVRNPLTAIRIDLQVVEEGLPAGSPLRAIQSRALEEIVRLDRTVGDALADAREGGLGTRELDVREPLRRAIHAATPECAAQGVTPPSLEGMPAVLVRGEPGALTQLFLNLLLNATQASPPGATVEVEVERRGEQVAIGIHDRGPGIPDAALTRAFEPFFSTRAAGTGLGLSVARRIAEAHGGTLELQNREGGGATALVLLPRASEV